MRTTTTPIHVIVGTTTYIIDEEDIQHAEELKQKYPALPTSIKEVAVILALGEVAELTKRLAEIEMMLAIPEIVRISISSEGFEYNINTTDTATLGVKGWGKLLSELAEYSHLP